MWRNNHAQLFIQTVAEERNRKILPGNVGEKTNCGGKEPRGVSDAAMNLESTFILLYVKRLQGVC